MQTIPVICGPTASGKTEFAKIIASQYKIQLVNFDSRQVYKYFDIGTNKGETKYTGDDFTSDSLRIPRVTIDNTVNCWLIDFLEPEVDFNVSNVLKIIPDLLKKISDDGFTPVLIGGTGLYLHALINNFTLKTTPNQELRSALKLKTVKELQRELQNLNFDLSKLNNSDLNNKHRLIRIYEKLTSANQEHDIHSNQDFEFVLFYPEFKRDELYKIINRRVDQMFNIGLVEEVKRLLQKGYSNTKAMNGIGYKEVKQYIDGKIKLDECIERIKISHRNYAKRQITWFEGEARDYDLIKVTPENILENFRKFFESVAEKI